MGDGNKIKNIMKQERIKSKNEGQTLLDLIVNSGDNVIKEYHKKYHFLPYIDMLDCYVKMLSLTIKQITEGFIDSETDREKMLTRLRVVKQKMLAFKEKITLENQIQQHKKHSILDIANRLHSNNSHLHKI